jgi:hypothetical protein
LSVTAEIDQTPDVRGILDLTNSRYGRVVKMDGDVAVFDDVYNPTRRTFSSKNFYAKTKTNPKQQKT